MACGDRCSSCWPSKEISPELGCCAPEIRLKSVLFPAPFGPITPKSSPLLDLTAHIIESLHPSKVLGDMMQGEQRTLLGQSTLHSGCNCHCHHRFRKTHVLKGTEHKYNFSAMSSFMIVLTRMVWYALDHLIV